MSKKSDFQKMTEKNISEKRVIDILYWIEIDLKRIQREGGTMNHASWGYEEGILLTGNDASVLVSYFKSKIQ